MISFAVVCFGVKAFTRCCMLNVNLFFHFHLHWGCTMSIRGSISHFCGKKTFPKDLQPLGGSRLHHWGQHLYIGSRTHFLTPLLTKNTTANVSKGDLGVWGIQCLNSPIVCVAFSVIIVRPLHFGFGLLCFDASTLSGSVQQMKWQCLSLFLVCGYINFL